MKLERNSQWNLNMYKWMFIVATFSLMGLTYSYCNDFNGGSSISGSYRTLMLILFLCSIMFSVINVVNSHSLSKIIFSLTD